jgi:hypothetical protein
MAKFFFTETRVINLDAITYVDNEVDGQELGISFIGGDTDTYDLKLRGKEAEELLLALEKAS